MNIANQGLFAIIAGIFILVTNVVTSVAIVMFSEKTSSPEFVFGHFNNQTGFDERYDGYVWCLGLLFSLYCLINQETTGTMSEETYQAAETAPQSLVLANLLSIFSGFIFILSVLYAIRDDISSVLNGTT
jgi:amino acid transporter